MSVLRYRAGAEPDELQPGECCVRPCQDDKGRYWHLTLAYTRRDNGERDWVQVPVDPRTPYVQASTPPRQSWSLSDVGGGAWQIAPSIRCTETSGDTGVEVEVYHETPRIEGVPPTEPWVQGGAP